MEFAIKNRVVNVRVAKDEKPEVSTTPTHGNFKINAVGAAALGMKNEDYIDVVIGEDEKVYIGKGVAPVKQKNEDTGKMETVEAAIGAKLASANGKLSGTLQASSASAYTALKGTDTENLIYSIDVENPQTAPDGTKYYALEFSRTEPKQVKKAKEA